MARTVRMNMINWHVWKEINQKKKQMNWICCFCRGSFVVEVITESLKAEKKEKKTKDKKGAENATEKIEDVANDVDAAGKKKADKAPAGKEAKKEAEPGKEAEKPKGDAPVIDGKLEDVVSWHTDVPDTFVTVL